LGSFTLRMLSRKWARPACMSQCRTHIEGDDRKRDGAFSGPATAAGGRISGFVLVTRSTRSIARSLVSRVTLTSCNGSCATAAAMTILIGSILFRSRLSARDNQTREDFDSALIIYAKNKPWTVAKCPSFSLLFIITLIRPRICIARKWPTRVQQRGYNRR